MSPELERVREKLYERASITLTNLFERLVREDQDKISREDERAGEGAMTDELKQLAAERLKKWKPKSSSSGVEPHMIDFAVDFGREVQRQTVEAACRLLCPYCEYGMPAYPLNGVKTSNGKPFWHQDQFDHNLYHECKAAPVRALLSPSQEVRSGF